MDLFKFTDANPTNHINGQAINGYDSVMWIERYREPGEFEIVAPLSSGLRSFLPLGTAISHINTLELAIVESHHIEEHVDSDPVITITGRSFDAYLENRTVGKSLAVGAPVPFIDYVLPIDYTWTQAVKLINDHVYFADVIDPNDSLSYVMANTGVGSIPTAIDEERTVKRGSLHKALIELLSVDDLGIRITRKNGFSLYGMGSTWFYIHDGNDKTSTVIFSWLAGELEGAEYLWSSKKQKNTAHVQGKFVEVVVHTGAQNYDRRVVFVDASDLDEQWNDPPTGTALTDIRAKMEIRGKEALANQNEVNIISADMSNITPYEYRKDYDIGDIVSIDGNYGAIEQRRVIEYVEIEDESGESGHPTLAVIEQ